MNCTKCGAELRGKAYCPNCGADVRIYVKIEKLANAYYNRGLGRAKVRDLTGAAEDLRQCLKINKNHIQARNLLGLVYFETGEIVDALAQWIISKNIQPDQNPANHYMKVVQKNPNRLEELNQAVRKFNTSLGYCRQESYDLAVIQLKKVLSQNGKFVKAHLLLGLLYVRSGKYDRAEREFNRALAVDATNPQALLYLGELEEMTGKNGKKVKPKNPEPERKNEVIGDDVISYTSGNETIIMPKKPYRETTGANLIVNLIIGMVVGVALMWFLVVPARIRSAHKEANQQVLEYSDQLAAKQSEIDSISAQLKAAESKLEEMENSGGDESLAVMNDLLAQALIAYGNGSKDTAADIASRINEDSLTEAEQQLFIPMNYEFDPDHYTQLEAEGKSAYEAQDYTEAIRKLRPAAIAFAEMDDGYAVYYLASAYDQEGQYTEALAWYNKFLEIRPNTERAANAQEAINRITPLVD